MALITKRQLLALYKSLLRESEKFPAYNFRMFALRKTRDDFRKNRNLNDSDTITNAYNEGLKSLDVIKRQVIIGRLYSTDKLVIEHVAH